jgi:hypothetical protein
VATLEDCFDRLSDDYEPTGFHRFGLEHQPVKGTIFV